MSAFFTLTVLAGAPFKLRAALAPRGINTASSTATMIKTGINFLALFLFSIILVFNLDYSAVVSIKACLEQQIISLVIKINLGL